MAKHRFKYDSVSMDDGTLVVSGVITYSYGMQEPVQLRIGNWRDLAKALVRLVVS